MACLPLGLFGLLLAAEQDPGLQHSKRRKCQESAAASAICLTDDTGIPQNGK